MPQDSPSNTSRSQRKWPGVLLSLFVPGFGLVRAGNWKRGLLWFFGVLFAGYLVTFLAITRAIPTWAVFLAISLAAGLQIAMLRDSFRSGCLTAGKWILFPGAILATFVLTSIPHFVAQALVVSTNNMAPTLQHSSNGFSDHIITDRLCYLISKPKRGDLVVFRSDSIAGLPAGKFLIQRLVGLPGETIKIQDGRILANDRQLGTNDKIPEFRYSNVQNSLSASSDGIYHVPPGSYFMLGDNSQASYDSRCWGYLPAKNIYARVARIYFPLSRAGVPE